MLITCSPIDVRIVATEEKVVGTKVSIPRRRTYYTWEKVPTTKMPICVSSPSQSPSMAPAVDETSWPSVAPSFLSFIVEDIGEDAATTTDAASVRRNHIFLVLQWSFLLVSVTLYGGCGGLAIQQPKPWSKQL